jgi:hypothetical protein
MAINKNEFIIEPLEKAYATFIRFYCKADPNIDLDRAAIIQAFEFGIS